MKEIKKQRLLYADEDSTLSYRRGYLIYRTDKQTVKCKIGGRYNSISLVERLMRKEPRCAVRVDLAHILISFEGQILNYSINDNRAIVEHEFSKGMNNPLEFLCFQNPSTSKTEVLYGEYIWNENKGPVSIYRRRDGKWTVAYTFPDKTITHIHNVINDEFRHGFIILTGDEDSESGIWFADYDFKTVKPILLGSQQYRACVAFPVENGIYYATDTPLEKNYVYYVPLNDNIVAQCVEKKYEMPGPCIYGCEFGSYMYFSTSVEPDSSLNKWRYRFTYKLGEGVKDRYSHIIRGNSEGEFDDVYQFKKDLLPIWLFQFGNVLFPKNDGRELFAVLQSSKEGHGVTVKLGG